MPTVRRALTVTALCCVVTGAASAQPIATGETPSVPRGDAYYQFLLGRHFEGEGDVERAIEALREASRLDPASAEIPAELSGLYARQGRAAEALKAGASALALDPENPEAHRVLGLLYAAMAEQRRSDGRQTRPDRRLEFAERAIDHLERVGRAPAADPRLQLTLARLYVETGANDRALALLTAYLEREPDSSEALFLLSGLYARSGKRPDAIALLERVVDNRPRFLRAIVTLAELYEQERRWRDAATAYGKANELNPDIPEIRERWATSLLSAGEPMRAAELLRVVARNSEDPSVLYLLAEAERRVGNLEAAERAARQLTARDADDLRGVFALARILQQRREYREAAAVLTGAIDRARGRDRAPQQIASLMVDLAEVRRALDEPEAAVRTLEDASRLAPGDGRVAARLLQTYLDLERPEAALEAAGRLAGRHPADLRIARLHAEALVQADRTAEAIRLLEEAVQANAADPYGHAALADLLANAGRADRALATLRSARERFPDDPTILFQLGAVHEQEGSYPEAERAFRDLLAQDPAHAPALNYLGYMMAERGDRLEEALALIQRALDIDPDNAAYLDSLGWAYVQLDRLDLAEGPLGRASQELQQSSVVQDHFGELLFRLGRYDEAIAAWERALAGDLEAVEPERLEQKIDTARQKARNSRN